MKKMMMLLLVMVMCLPVLAETNIFGTDPGNKQFAVTAGSDSAIVTMGWSPAERFVWGFRIAGSLTEAADQTASKWDTTLIGIGIECPVVGLESLFEGLPVDGEMYLGIALDCDIENDQQLYVPIEVGVDVQVSKDDKSEVMFRMAKAVTDLNNGNDTPYPDIRFGVCVKW